MSDQPLKVLLAASEVVPFAKTGGLADVAGSLPKALAAQGHDVRIVLPKYRAVTEAKIASRKVVGDLPVPPWAGLTVNIEQSNAIEGVPTYLVVSDKHFDRGKLYGEPDDAVRFAVYQRALLEMLPKLDWQPDVIHCNDWQTGLVPVFLKRMYADNPFYSGIATLYTIHNLAYQGAVPRYVLPELGLSWDLFTPDGVEFYDQLNPMKAGMVFADMISTVSKRYSEEIQTAEYGEKLEGVLSARRDHLAGIVNGIDYEQWDPATDPCLAAPFDVQSRARKRENRAALRHDVKLPDDEVPLIGIISRLAAQKGFDLLAEVVPHLAKLEMQLVVLGMGEQHYHDLFSEFAIQYPDQVAVTLAFNDHLAHRIYAGSDMFLMPSRYEPCGLGQMISLRYGNIPIVRATGGLADTITDFDRNTGKGNGFSFTEYTPLALAATVFRAIEAYHHPKAWDQLVQNAMTCDFSWNVSAAKYVEVYRKAMQRRGAA